MPDMVLGEWNMTKFMCVYCGRLFRMEDISEPMKDCRGWVNMRDSCPVCRKGLGDWFRCCRWVKGDPVFLLKAIRVQRNVREVPQ